MIQHPGRILKAIFALVLLPISQSFATVIYVNGANPTNGGGTSWADPFNNLQSAIAVARTFDQIWIAQGTYYPSVPAGRSATFANTNGYAMYGGFNGTESSTSQANPTLYPTILSGDIGTPGNPSDNCYHVLSFDANLWYYSYNGLTIRDGRADGAFPDNTGGGVLFLAANSGQAAANYFNNCIFSNNYAVYGGAIGAYGGNNCLQINYGATNCFFHDNQAVYGGAIYNTIINGEFLYTFENDIFYNNTASSGKASVFGNVVTNSSTTQYFQMENCLFYNEAAPILTNDYTNSGTTAPQTNYDIIWTSGTPYTAGFSAGNNPIVINNSDIDGTLPSATDFDADPLFVNAAGDNFHVSPCSPVIDAGTTYSPTTYDIGGSQRMQGPRVDIGPYETLKGSPAAEPTATTPVIFCQNSTATALSATGTNLLWYTTATGGTSSATAPTPTTTTTGTTAYYVTQTPTGTCESNRLEIDVTVNSQSSLPTVNPGPSYCENATAAALTATGTNLLWYTTATGGTGSTTAPTPTTTSPGQATWYVTQTTNGCESMRAPVTVTIMSPSPNPSVNPIPAYCVNTTAAPLNTDVTGTNLLWYTAATGGASSTTAPTPTTTSPGQATWYVTQTSTGCESLRVPVTVTVASPGAAPTANPVTPYCENATAAPLTATGTNLLWYTSATGGTGSSTAPTPSTTSPGSTTWYVSQTPANSCESNRSPVTVTINPIPNITIDPVTGSLCAGKDIKLQAQGADSYQWSPATGLTDPSISDPVALLQDDIRYTVTGTTAGCSATAEVNLSVSTNCMAIGYYVPNAFSPNGDGRNDIFRVRTGDVPKSFEMTIFNRYGSKIFESADIDTGWNGTIDGNTAPAGTYVYTLVLTTSTGETIRRNGTIILVR